MVTDTFLALSKTVPNAGELPENCNFSMKKGDTLFNTILKSFITHKKLTSPTCPVASVVEVDSK